jgi:hypothetical protein
MYGESNRYSVVGKECSSLEGVGAAIDVRQQGESVQYSVVEKECSFLEGVGGAIDVR